MRKRLGRVLRALVLLAAGTLLGMAWMSGSVDASGSHAAQDAIRDTGIDLTRTENVTALHCSTYSRDGDETVILQLPDDGTRGAVWQAVCAAPDWRQGQISAAAYTALAQAKFWPPNAVVAPAADVVFDAWLYRDDYALRYGEFAQVGDYVDLPEDFALNGTPDTLNATFVFYDKETGAFFYHSYDM